MILSRIFIIVLDGVGAGELPDAADYGDEGSNTLANTAAAVGGLNLPNMAKLGLGNIISIEGVPPANRPLSCYGKMREASAGKDTITGHWEMAGAVLLQPFPTYPNGFPTELIAEFEKTIGIRTIGNCAASGTEIIARLGAKHVLTGCPIVYTSADSVFQIAMHEAVIPIERQYEICEIVRRQLTGEHAVGRVICRPFIGDGGDPLVRQKLPGYEAAVETGPFRRTERRKDFPLNAPRNVLDELTVAGKNVHAIGKIYEIFNGRGITTQAHTTNNPAHIAALMDAARTSNAELVFANLEDFDMLYGHRNDVVGMARALEEWDAALPELLGLLRTGDLLIITADHGNDPTTPSTDHSREYPFLLAFSPDMNSGLDLGIRNTYADVAATIRDAFGLPAGAHGVGFLDAISNS